MNTSGLHEWFDATLEGIEPEDLATIEETVKSGASLTVSNWREVKRILKKNNEVSISLSIKLTVAGAKRVKGAVKMAWAEKFTDDAEFLTSDPDQPDLFKAEPQSVASNPKPKPATGSMAVATRGNMGVMGRGVVVDVEEVKKPARPQKLLPAPAEEKPKRKNKKGGSK